MTRGARLLAGATCLAASLAAGLAAPAHAATAPAAWTEYAGGLAQRIAARLARADDPVAGRLHAFLDAQAASQPGAAPPRVVARVWVGADGAVTDARFASLGDAGADADLRAVLLGLGTGPTPPADMAQPVTLRLALATPG